MSFIVLSSHNLISALLPFSSAGPGFYASLPFLISASVYDMKYGRINMAITLSFLGTGIVFRLFGGSFREVPCALIPGLILCLISVLSGNLLGFGDGITALILALFFGISGIISAMLFSFAGASAAALVILMSGKSKKTCFPFIPFITSGVIASAAAGLL